MKKLNQFIIISLLKLSLIIISLNNFSHAAANSNQNVTGTIARIYLQDSNYFFRFSGADTCARPSANEYYIFTTATPLSKQYYALLLATAHTKKEITVRIKTDCNTTKNKEFFYIFQDFK
jgi:hypothetical protein